MVPTIFTTETWLAHLLRRWVRQGITPSVSLVEDGAVVEVALETGEQPIAIIRTGDDKAFVFTSTRIVVHGDTLLRYSQVLRHHWITDNPAWRVTAERKHAHFDCLIIDLEDGRKVRLEKLGQAVFPLLRFFESVASP